VEALPSPLAVEANAEALAHCTAICQEQGIVPIVEPEVLIGGDYTIARCAEVTEAVLHEVFRALGGEVNEQGNSYTYPQPTINGSAFTLGSRFGRHGGSKLDRRGQFTYKHRRHQS
jgi:Fructose-bisphosphate aldolase class-I